MTSARSSKLPSNRLNRTFDSASWTSSLCFAMAFAPLIYCWFFASFRYAPYIGLGIAVALAIGVLVLRGRVDDTGIIPLLLVATLYLLLSLGHYLPSSWTRYWIPTLAVRQWMWVPLLLIFSSSFFVLFYNYRNFLIRNAFSLLIITFVCGRISLYFSPLQFSNKLIFSIYTLVPENATFMIFLGFCVFFKVKPNFKNFILLLMFIPIFTSAQSLVAYLSLLTIRFFGFGRTILAAATAVILIGMFVGPNYVKEIYQLDSNSGFRAVLWRDATQAILDTNFIGVGFGTEYIKNQFDPGGSKESYVITTEHSEKRFLIGTHNTPFDITMRMGGLGLLALIYWLVFLAKPLLTSRNPDLMFSSYILMLMLINNALNMGVTSINFMFCTALCSGLLISIRVYNKTDLISSTVKLRPISKISDAG